MVPAPLSGISRGSRLTEHPGQSRSKVASAPREAVAKPWSSALSWILLCVDSGNSWPGCCGAQDHRLSIANKGHFLKAGVQERRSGGLPATGWALPQQFPNRKRTALLFLPVPTSCLRRIAGQQRRALLFPVISLSPQDDSVE